MMRSLFAAVSGLKTLSSGWILSVTMIANVNTFDLKGVG